MPSYAHVARAQGTTCWYSGLRIGDLSAMSLSASDVGFDEGRYVQPGVVALLTCPLCRHAPKVDAQFLTCCGQSACAKCVLACGQRGFTVPSCPFCRAGTTVRPDRSFQESLAYVQVRCKHAPCCQWVGGFTAAPGHEDGCEVGQLRTQLEGKDLLLAEAKEEQKVLLGELMQARCVITRLQREAADAKAALAAVTGDVERRRELINAILDAPTSCLDAARAALSPRCEADNAETDDADTAAKPTSSALCRAGARSRSPRPRGRL